MIGEERDDVSRWFPNRESPVVGRRGSDRRGIKAEVDEAPVRCFEILDHQIKWCLARNRSRPWRENQMRAAAKLEHGHFGPLNDRAHPDRSHELLCFCQAIRLQDNVADPYLRPQILFAGHRPTPVPAPSPHPFRPPRKRSRGHTAVLCAAARCRQSSRSARRSPRTGGRARSIRR